jgi:hypothetical protein
MAPRPPDDARKKFNRLVGNRTGRPSTPSPHVSTTGIRQRRELKEAGAGRGPISTYVQHGGGKVSARTRREHKQWFGSGAESTVDPISGANQAFENIFDNLTSEYNRQILDEKAIHTEYANKIMDQATSPEAQGGGTVEVNGEQIPVMAARPVSESYMGSNIYKYALEPLQRPLSAVAGGGLEMMQQVLEDTNAGKSNWEEFTGQVGAFKHGAQEALTGKTHHGTGDVYELIKNEFKAGAPLRGLEEHAPWAEQQIARGAGITGDIAFDITGHIGGIKAGVIKGNRATSASMRQYVRELAEKWAADAETNVVTGAAKAPGGYRTFPSEAAMADHFEKVMNDLLDTAELEVSAGGSRRRYEVLNPKMTAELAGAHGSESLQKSLTALFTDRVQRLTDGVTGRGPKLSGSAIDQWKALNPDFTEFIDELTDTLIADNKLPQNATSDVLAGYLSAGDEKIIRAVEQSIIDQKYTSYITEASDAIAREFRNDYYNAPGIRIGSKVIPVKAAGRAYASLASKHFDDIGKNFRYNSVFPGSLSLDTTKARAWGVRATEDFENTIREKAAPFSKADGIEIQRAIEHNTIHTLSQAMKDVANWIVDQYRWMHNDEFLNGARGRKAGSKPGVDSSTTPYDPNYAYVSNKGGGLDDRGRFKADRKATIHDNVRKGNGEGAGRYKTENAKAEGLRPVENAFDALRQRRIKYNRDMIRARFRADMIDKYGIYSRISPGGRGFSAQQRGLEEVSFHNLPESIRVNVEQSGERVYLPKEMAQMINTFDDITKWNASTQGRVARSFASVMRILKKTMTLPWTGFHVKNMIGDVFMGLLDGILPHHYAKVIKKGMAAIGGKDTFFTFIKGQPGLDISFRDMWKKYQSEANSGFINAELASPSVSRYNIPKRILGRADQIAQDISGFREDAGRFTHYVTAYEQELKALWKKGERDIDKLQQKASSAALWRVNNYKFDYNALTLWEKQAKTLYFPFFTFIRKAAPTLVQAMYQDPRWINAWTRFLYQNQMPDGQEGASGFDAFRVPDHVRDIGHAFVGGQTDEPWYVTNDILPTSVLNSVRTENPHEFFNSILSQTALPYQVAIEQGTGRQTFLDMPLEDQGIADYLLNKLPGTREVKSVIDPEKSWTEKLLSNRVFAGLPIHQLGEDQQLQALREWQDVLIDDPISAINTSQDMFYVAHETSQSGQATIYTVKSMMTRDASGNATDLASFYTAEDAIQYVKKHLPEDYTKIPTRVDIDNQGNPYYRPVSN